MSNLQTTCSPKTRAEANLSATKTERNWTKKATAVFLGITLISSCVSLERQDEVKTNQAVTLAAQLRLTLSSLETTRLKPVKIGYNAELPVQSTNFVSAIDPAIQERIEGLTPAIHSLNGTEAKYLLDYNTMHSYLANGIKTLESAPQYTSYIAEKQRVSATPDAIAKLATGLAVVLFLINNIGLARLEKRQKKELELLRTSGERAAADTVA